MKKNILVQMVKVNPINNLKLEMENRKRNFIMGNNRQRFGLNRTEPQNHGSTV